MPPFAKHPTPTIDDLRVKLCYICREEEGPEDNENHEQPEQAPSDPKLQPDDVAADGRPPTDGRDPELVDGQREAEPLPGDQRLQVEPQQPRPPPPAAPVAPAERSPRRWIHPCQCTLVAHESCLLQWIQTAEKDSSRAANALKCPQCGAKYVMQSENPWVLQLMRRVGGMGVWMGRWCMVGMTVGVVGVVGSSVWVILTAYGAWAVRQFIGQEMFELVLSDDPYNWPWPTFFNLPAIPLSLIASRLRNNQHFMPLLPILLLWPYHPQERFYRVDLPPSTTQPTSSSWLSLRSSDSQHITFTRTTRSFLSIPSAWPPSPFVFGLFILPIIRNLYRRWFRRLEKYVLGPEAIELEGGDGGRQGGRRRRNGQNNEEGEVEEEEEADVLEIHIRANIIDDDGGPGAQQGHQENAGAEGNPNNAARNANNNAANNNNNNEAPANDGRGRRRNINLTSLGQTIGGALLTPAIASLMGSMLYHLSQHIPALKAFLGIRPSLVSSLKKLASTAAANLANGAPASMSPKSADGPGIRSLLNSGPDGNKSLWGTGWTAGLGLGLGLGSLPNGLGASSGLAVPESVLGYLKQIGWTIRLVMANVLGGHGNATFAKGLNGSWAEADPVWWRNSVGLGVFVLARDCIELWYRWLLQREIKSRHLRSNDFKGIDIKELDLKPSFYQALRAAGGVPAQVDRFVI